jgi:hypothetical protein
VTHLFGAWGLLPLVVPLFAFVATRLGAIAAPSRETGQRSLADQAVAGVILAFALVIATVRALSLVHAVTPVALVGALVIASLAAGLARAGTRPRTAAFTQPPVGAVAMLVVTGAALVLAVVAARWLPVWQWDAVGYHLPFVRFVLDARSLDAVPVDLEYVGSYPHDVELFFVALRACLPDDRLVDLGQIPFGIGGAVVTAALARRTGASAWSSVVAGASWVLVPAVFLELPTNYVDVAAATFCLVAVYFVLGPASPRGLALGGLAVGLLVGSKPNGPLSGGLLLGLLAARGLRAGHTRGVAVACALACLFGAESYVSTAIHHGNPVWPVALDLGPLHLPGTHAFGDILTSGANAPHLTGPLPYRVLRSLVSLGSPPVFDTRVGGFGPAVLVALPFALAWFVRARSPVAWLALVASLLCPDPAVARYVLAFPALVLATALAEITRLAGSSRRRSDVETGVGLLAAGLGIFEVWYAAPGLVGEGPPLLSYRAMSEEERVVAVGADGRPTTVAEARQRIGEDEAFAFDGSMDLCGLAWDPLGPSRVVFLPPSLREDAVGGELLAGRVRVFVAGDDAPAGLWARAHPDVVERLPGRVSCREGPCAIYARR